MFIKLMLLGSILIINTIWLSMLQIHFAPTTPTTLYVLDVGQGDASLIITSQNKVILIDAGPHKNILAPFSHYLPPFVSYIDLVILTHPHADHLDGLLSLFSRYHVRGILITNIAYSGVGYSRFLTMARQLDVPIYFAQADVDWQLEDGLTLDVLFPFTSLEGATFRNVNNASVVLMLKAKSTQCLFTGDMEKELEMLLVDYYQNYLAANCLKVGHHGSKTSSMPQFLQFVHPETMFVSVGVENNYHHPDELTLYRLCYYGTVYRTDQVGTIKKILLQ